MSDPDKRHRRSLRLRHFDYSSAGAYFFTVCVRNRSCSLSVVTNGRVEHAKSGQIVWDTWLSLPSRFPGVQTDVFVVMPNHVHGILMIEEGAMNRAPTLGEVVRTLKASVTHRVRHESEASFAWQRNYYEHVIRTEKDMLSIRQYIADNPAGWDHDEENPYRHSSGNRS